MRVVVVALVALLAALQLRLWFGEGSVQELWRVREEAHSSRAEVLALRARNQALRAEVADLKSGLEAIEERARTDLGMVDADETFYQFVRAPGAVERATEAATEGAIDGVIGGDESGRTRRVE